MGLDFVAIDFETANAYERGSACAIGLVSVQNGVVIDRFYTSLNPMMVFSPQCVQVHGMTYVDVLDAPTLPQKWNDIRMFIGNAPLVAHNAVFDIAVLERSLFVWGLGAIKKDYTCTMKIAKSLCEKGQSLKLDVLCELFGINLREHHNAAEDAEACALLCIELAKKAHASSLDELLCVADLPWENTETNSYKPENEGCCDFLEASVMNTVTWYMQQPRTDTPVFRDITVVFTGQLVTMERSDAQRIVRALGGRVTSCVSKKTDILVVGIQDENMLVGLHSSKHQKALDLAEAGHNIIIADENMFLRWLTGEPMMRSEKAPEPVTNKCDQLKEYADAYQAILSICVDHNSHSADYLEYKMAKDSKYMSVYMFKQKGIQYTIASKKRYIEISERILIEDEMSHEDIEEIVASGNSEYEFRPNSDPSLSVWRINLNCPDDIQKHRKLLDDISDALLAQATADRFGCCSSFIECSNTGECLNKGNVEYVGCYYRENLEAGRVFYGKNKTI